MTLRSRLLAVLLALLALVSGVVGLTTELVLHRYLVGRLDTQLSMAAVRGGPDADDQVGHPHAPAAGGPDGVASAAAPAPAAACPAAAGAPAGLGGRGQAVGTVQAEYVGTTLCAGVELSDEAASAYSGFMAVQMPLRAAVTRVLAALPADGVARTRELAGLGSYRLVAIRAPSGTVVVTGLPQSGVDQTVRHLIYVELAVTGAGLLLAGLIGASTVRVALRSLRRVAATATGVTELELGRGEVALAERVPDRDTDPRTEVGQVGAALNALLGHVDAALTARQASETQVRQFVADASHELRTPLAAIRGYAELTRRGREVAPPDIAYALTRVESEAGRMTTLVEDLLLLARLDAGRPLEVGTVDLTALLVDAVSDAHAAGPRHVWRLDVPDEAVEAPGDAARLHQVVANLLANARTHTPPGTPVTVGLRLDDSEARITVTDEGPGVPPELTPTVFERFARADTSRSRAAGSTGLGLAIVAAVVSAHDGSVTLDSRPGATVFTVVLPARAQATSRAAGHTAGTGHPQPVDSQAIDSGLTAARMPPHQ